jgi:hypothetical protein
LSEGSYERSKSFRICTSDFAVRTKTDLQTRGVLSAANASFPGMSLGIGQWTPQRCEVTKDPVIAPAFVSHFKKCLDRDCESLFILHLIESGFMRVFPDVNAKSGVLCALLLGASAALGQNAPPAKVTIPNPTPRPPDLKQEYSDNPADQKKNDAISIQNQLRAREIWLESNQILLLAQQLQEEILSDKKSTAMTASAAKAGKIEKLAQSVQEKMKVH